MVSRAECGRSVPRNDPCGLAERRYQVTIGAIIALLVLAAGCALGGWLLGCRRPAPSPIVVGEIEAQGAALLESEQGKSDEQAVAEDLEMLRRRFPERYP